MPTIQGELLSLSTDLAELRPALVAEFVKWTDSGERSKIEDGRWNLAVGVGCDSRLLLPDLWLPVRDTLWGARLDLLRQARAARRWGDVSQLAYELLLLAPDRVGELALDDDAFAALDFELPSVFDHQSAFLARAYQLVVLYPGRRAEISAFDEYLPTLFEALGRVPAPSYMDYSWLAAELRVIYPDAALRLDPDHMASAVRDCVIDREIVRRGGAPLGFAAKAAPLKLLAAREIQLTDHGPVAVLP